MDKPTVFGKYLLLDRINVGGMAEVFKAKTFGIEGFERILAIKRILPNMAEDQEFVDMFVDEARIAVQLSHPNIVQIFELGKFESQLYIAMEYVSGRDLRQLLSFFRKNEKQIPLEVGVFVISELARGLHYAHNKCDSTGKPLNVIHRDISPQNMLLGYDGEVKLTDFGIARAEDRLSKTQVGVLKGKFAYMSPEQVRGQKTDYRSDLFALGILAFEMIAGQRLFLGESDFDTLEKVRAGSVPSPRSIRQDIPENLEAVILKMLTIDMNERFQSGAEIANALKPFLEREENLFDSVAMGAFMRETFAESLKRELDLMKEYKEKAMASMGRDLDTGAKEMAAALKAAEERGWSVEDESLNEKTVIFNSGFGDFADAPTRIFTAGEVEAGKNVQVIEEHPATENEIGMVANDDEVSPAAHEHAKAWYKRPARLLTLSAVLLSLLAFLFFFFFWPSHGGGIIEVTSEPASGLTISLDEKVIGTQTPLTYTGIGEGEHSIKASADGFQTQEYRFYVEEGTRTPVQFHLKQISDSSTQVGAGVLQVVTTPAGASVYIDGVSRGITPLTVSGLTLGTTSNLQVRQTGYVPQNMSVTLSDAEKEKRLNFTLMPLPSGSAPLRVINSGEGGSGTVLLFATPTDASITLNGVDMGQAPLQVTNLQIAKAHSVKVEKPGYRAQTSQVTFSPQSQSATLNITLLPFKSGASIGTESGKGSQEADEKCVVSGGKLSVMPIGGMDCQVLVGTIELGLAPFFQKSSPMGKCKVTVTCDQERTYTKTISITPDGNTKLIIRPSDWN